MKAWWVGWLEGLLLSLLMSAFEGFALGTERKAANISFSTVEINLLWTHWDSLATSLFMHLWQSRLAKLAAIFLSQEEKFLGKECEQLVLPFLSSEAFFCEGRTYDSWGNDWKGTTSIEHLHSGNVRRQRKLGNH